MISHSRLTRAYGNPPSCVRAARVAFCLVPAVWQHRGKRMYSLDVAKLPKFAARDRGIGMPGRGSQARDHYSHRAVAPGAVTVRGL
jgi:hypothetical protein